ncbi:hypothetical protein BMS3Abin14_02135 [bacterium BMS3Abin14]|nr:hypothetical protein BMS3Abin14_02135 [bacterium BMS3Abin14]
MAKDCGELVRFMEEDIPFNKLLGIKVEECREGFARVTVPFRDELVGDARRPALHGGVLSAVIDACGGLAVWSRFELRDLIATVDMRTDFLRPGPNCDICVESNVVRMGNRVSVVHSIVYPAGDRSTIVAEGRAVYNTRRADDR